VYPNRNDPRATVILPITPALLANEEAVSAVPWIVSAALVVAQSPVDRLMIAVNEQTMIVSTQTSATPMRPWWTGDLAWAAAWAMGALPSPASLVRSPRRKPICMAVFTV